MAAAGDRVIAVFNLDGEVVAIDDRCAHKEQPLAGGVVRDGILTCPSHLWRYDLRTGQRVDAPGWAVPRHEVRVIDGEIVVEVPEPTPAKSMRQLLLEHARQWERGDEA